MSRIIVLLGLLLCGSLAGCVGGPRPVDVVPTLNFGSANGATRPAPTTTTAPLPVEPDSGPGATAPTVPAPVVVAPTPIRQPAQSALNRFGQELAAAIAARDFEAMRALMGDRFSIATYNTQLMNYDSDEALDMLRADLLAPGSAPAARFGTDVATLLNGTDPLGLWGPVDDPVKAVHVTGTSSNGSEEAVMVIGRNAAGGFFWLGVLVPQSGFFQREDVSDVLETEIEWVEALDDLNVRSGPGLNYVVEGMVREGEIARVTGISASRQWWRIACTQDSSGNCWISAADDLTRPSSVP